jgi:hypothetical protein
MEQHPRLVPNGIGVFDAHRKTRAQREAELAEGRAELMAREGFVLEVAAWLVQNVTAIQTPTIGSYRMKHVVENAIGKYVTNGELIAAALLAGYAFKYDDGPNVLFGMSKRDVDRISEAGRRSR